jgi:hypothetical protein
MALGKSMKEGEDSMWFRTPKKWWAYYLQILLGEAIAVMIFTALFVGARVAMPFMFVPNSFAMALANAAAFAAATGTGAYLSGGFVHAGHLLGAWIAGWVGQLTSGRMQEEDRPSHTANVYVRYIQPITLIVYLIAHVGGAFAGAALVLGWFGQANYDVFAEPMPGPLSGGPSDPWDGRAWFFEASGAFILALPIMLFYLYDKMLAIVIIGSILSGGLSIVGFNVSGAVFNPFTWLAAAALTSDGLSGLTVAGWTCYVFGGIIGGIAAGIVAGIIYGLAGTRPSEAYAMSQLNEKFAISSVAALSKKGKKKSRRGQGRGEEANILDGM